MAKRPVWDVSRSGSTVTITISNRGADLVKVYASNKSNTSFSLLDSGYQDTFTDPDVTTNKKYKVRLVEGATEVINTSTEIINTSTELIRESPDSIISTSKFTK